MRKSSSQLARAVLKLDLSRDSDFAVYAGWWIRNCIDEAILAKLQTIRVPSNMVNRIRRVREAEGELARNLGRTPTVEEIAEGIRNGVRKVNIDTDLRMASTGAVRRHLQENPSNFDPRKYLMAATEAMRDICINRYEAFNTAGNASKIKIVNLEDMTARYLTGELDPKIS